MMLCHHRADPSATATEILVLPFEARRKSRLRTCLASGEELGYWLSPGSVLRQGDKLLAEDGRVVAVVAADEPLLEVRAADATQLARAAYHLGNRHVAVQVAEGFLRVARDHVLQAMLEGLGCRVSEVVAPFEPEQGAYGHHHHGDGMQHGQARLHEFRVQP
jgi:urease accessory protein